MKKQFGRQSKIRAACACLAFAFFAAIAAHSAEPGKKERIMFVGAHPDDSEGFAATAFLLRDKYEIHIVDATRGEHGLGLRGFYDGTTARRRMAEEYDACSRLGATPHFLDEKDGCATAGSAAIDALANLLLEVRPKAVFTHWPIDAHVDHAMTAAIVAGALRQTRMRPELYYYEVLPSQTKNFSPLYYVDVTSTISNKVEMLRCYACQNDGGWLVERKLAQAGERGAERVPSVGYAETFATFDGKPVAGGVLENLKETAFVKKER